jgi:hypothetical protein
VAALVGFFAFPTYPNYDSYYSLLWGRELLDGQLPQYETYRAPTPHPLATGIGALLAPFGHAAERIWILLCVISFVALVAGVFRLAREVFTPLVGVTAALLLLTRFDFAFYAARGYIDIGYMASSSGRRSSRPAPRARGRSSCSCCSRSPASCARRRGSWRACTGCGSAGGRRGATGSGGRCSPRSGPWCGPAAT